MLGLKLIHVCKRGHRWLITESLLNCIFFNENFRIWFQILLKFVAMTRQQAIILTNDDLVQWCIYGTLGPNELKMRKMGWLKI